jgi:hypothetical protein
VVLWVGCITNRSNKELRKADFVNKQDARSLKASRVVSRFRFAIVLTQRARIKLQSLLLQRQPLIQMRWLNVANFDVDSSRPGAVKSCNDRSVSCLSLRRLSLIRGHKLLEQSAQSCLLQFPIHHVKVSHPIAQATFCNLSVHRFQGAFMPLPIQFLETVVPARMRMAIQPWMSRHFDIGRGAIGCRSIVKHWSQLLR